VNTPTNWQSYLKKEFADRTRKNPKYSLRAYAKSLQISPSHLSQVLSGKRAIKAPVAIRLAKIMDLTSVEMMGLLQDDDDTALASDLNQVQILGLGEFGLIASWHYYAILGLANLKSNVATAEWIAQKLNISNDVSKRSFDDLVRLGYISIVGHQFRQASEFLRTPADIPSQMARRYLKQNLQLAAQKIDLVDVAEREYNAMTLSINPRKMTIAKKMIRAFSESFTEEMSKGKNTEVYNLCIQFFPLTANLEKGRRP
jgi:plasmid maintenance system antidote protein VapI